MKRCACKIGNSSASIREGPFLGMPAVNIGSRQNARDRGGNVIDVDNNRNQIVAAIRRQLVHGPYPSESIYGDGHAGKRIADILSKAEFTIQKTIAY